MPEEQKEPKQEGQEKAPEKKEDAFKALEKKFDSFIDIIGEGITASSGRAPEPQTDAKKEPEISSTEFEEAGFDEKQLGVIGKIINKAVTAAISESKRDMVVETEQERYDRMAYKKFPDLKNKNSLFYKNAEAIMQRRSVYDKEIRKRPDVLWSIGHEIEESIKAQSENNSGNNAVRHSVSGGSVLEGSRGSSRIEGRKSDGEVSEERKLIRQKLGVSA